MRLRVKLRCWFWGLLPLILFGLFVGFFTKDLIEQNLTERSELALRSAGITWAKPAFKGLEGTIKGEAPSIKARLEAMKIVQKVWGVRTVSDQLSVVDIVSPFVWSGQHKDERLVLKGYVPNEKIRHSVIGLAKAKFPNTKLVDRMKIARGAPDESKWFGQISFGLSQLARMRQGSLSLADKTFNLRGSALDGAAYSSLTKAFEAKLPLEMVQGTVSILAPVVEKYYFTSRYNSTDVVLEGFAPTKKSVLKVKQSAQANFPNLKIQNNLQLGSGAPKGWEMAVLLSLAELSKLDSGSVNIEKRVVKFEGIAASNGIASSVRRTVRSAYPTGFKVNDVITVKAPVLTVASPFELRISAGSEIELSGVVESEEQRASVLASVNEHFPNRKINDQLTLAKGASDEFIAGVRAGVALMQPLNNARLLLSDAQLTVSGDTTDESLANGFATRPDGLPVGIDWINGVQFDDSLKREAAALKRAADEKDLAALKAKEEAEKKAISDAKAEEESKLKALTDKKVKEEQAAREKAELKKLTSKEEVAKRRKWLTPDQTEKRLMSLYKESGAVDAKECQLLMNSIVRGNAIRFGVNSSVITPTSFDVLTKVHSVATRCANTVIRVEGHTDSDGSKAYNLELSKRRARSVIGHLGKLGIPRSRLDTKGFGEKKPVASNGTVSGKALNRRIEFIVFEN